MQITRQADYALRAMLYLTRFEKVKKTPADQKDKHAATNVIAAEQKIPPSFLAKIISQLSIAGLITTSRGARGGVSLARPADQISLLEVVEAIDGPIALNECTINAGICAFGEDCPIHDVWCESQFELVNKLRTTTFASFVA